MIMIMRCATCPMEIDIEDMGAGKWVSARWERLDYSEAGTLYFCPDCQRGMGIA